ncbi:hypothetical protein [Frigoriglobus tundricola]|uniref:Lipoprotein n=1 Tax=Frigoriglobus tundricola TaxID=2774151 RepID=A0A6M5YPG4_9BACT|nr:hypothetical protein [Frigoriglobus tundricola]QJW95183.1 hypothetical protein FTUN_2722 [Frigoriglobus tundricola]
MTRWGLCWGVLFGAIACAAACAAMGWLEGAAVWLSWGAFVLFAWGAVMAVYAFDRPAPRV